MKFAVRKACAAALTAFVASGCGGGGGGEQGQGAGGTAKTTPPPAATPAESAPAAAAGGMSATLTGHVNLVGTPPAPAVLKMDADANCAKAHAGAAAVSEEVVVDAQGMLGNVFVYVKNGLEGKTFTPPADPVTLDQKGCTYHPHVIGMMAKQPLKILNSDPTLHNIHALPKAEGNKEFNLGMPRPGMEFTKTFDSPEVMVKIKCDVHPWMASYIGVVGHPYHAVTGAGGGFTIADLPAGTYTIEAWHEKYGTLTQNITVGDTPTVEVNFTFQSSGS
jgi:hypothetical protein